MISEMNLLGIALLLPGGVIILEPSFYSGTYQTYMDFTGYNIPLGIFMIIVGIYALWPTTNNKDKQ